MELPPSFDWGAAGNLGAVTMMGYIFWHVIVKGIPSIIERFTNEMGEARKDFRESLDSVVEHCREENKSTAEHILRAAGAAEKRKET